MINTMKRTAYYKGSITIILLLSRLITYGQSNINGMVGDHVGEPIPFANVLLLSKADSSLVTGSVSDIEGNFQLVGAQSGEFLIKATMVGYAPVIKNISIDGMNDVNLRKIHLQEDVQQLSEVVITAQKPLYEKLLDRTVVNVKSSITSTGKSALEVIEKSPGVNVNRQTSSISMQGKSGVLVMINGKMSRLPIDAVVQMLDGMSSSSIDKIELITTPPAKYDAEGDAGIINIVTTKNLANGTNGNFGLTGGYNKGETLGTNFNLNHRNDRFSYFVDYSILSDRNKNSWENERIVREEGFDKTVFNNSIREPHTTVQNIRTGIEYDLNSKTNAKVLVTGYRRNWDMDAITTDQNSLSMDSVINTEMVVHESNIWQSIGGSFGLRHKLNNRQQISVDFDYLHYDNNNPSNYNNTTSLNEESQEELIAVDKDTPINFKIVKFDYSNQLNESLKFETGLKSTFSRFNNKVSVRSFANETWSENAFLSNQSNLNEDIMAAYVSWDWTPLVGLKLNGGLRYEHTDSYLSSPEEEGLVDREFSNFFPSLFISKNLAEESSINLAYSKRISRPSFNDMAPFVFFAGPNTFIAGNPALKPVLSDGVDLSYQLKQWWVSIKYSHAANSIGFLQPEIDPTNNEQIFRSRNLEYLNTVSLTTSLPIAITSWWEIQNDASVNFQTFETAHLQDNFTEQVTSINISSTSSITLPKDYSLEVSGNYQSKSLFGIWQFEPLGQLNLGVRKKLKNDNGSISVNVSDVLHTSVWKLKTEIPEISATTNTKYDWNMRSVNVTYSRSFGNKKLKSVNIGSGSKEERSRIN